MIYINQEQGHNKFWGYGCELRNYRYVVGVVWGRIGTSLSNAQSQEKVFNSEWQARNFIDRKLRDKRAKGYIPLDMSYSDFIEKAEQDDDFVNTYFAINKETIKAV